MRNVPHPITLHDIEKSIEKWEEAIDWIAKGFDCIDEYTNDLYARESLDKDLSSCEDRISDDLLLRIIAADERFRNVTYVSDKCVWSDKQNYDPTKYWYYYRWQYDGSCPQTASGGS